ncbi:hypothetical protein DCAR_0313058 [Daucus carota subsp. sativus]|uniref:Uncharacterized protein n=1 Tax=Daucus carota subsp. sativus TaxID=79200 RepID=A0AAF0WR06_DAUCS|nr:hypothetical protein DCAR_0313058 [Daucus carota subsp. sativus]
MMLSISMFNQLFPLMFENRPGSGDWIVEVHNPYHCTQENVTLSCDGFKSQIPINPDLIKYDAEHIYIQPTIPPYDSMRFLYVSKTKFDMTPLSSTICC